MSKPQDSRPGPAPYEVTRDAASWVIRSGLLVLLLVGIYTTGAGYYLTHVDALPEAPGTTWLGRDSDSTWSVPTTSTSGTLVLGNSTKTEMAMANSSNRTGTFSRFINLSTGVTSNALVSDTLTITLPAKCVQGTTLRINADRYVCVSVSVNEWKAVR